MERATRIKNRMFYCFMLILFLPMLEHKLQFIISADLNNRQPTPDSTFSLQGWWDGGYQVGKEKYLNDETGFRPDLVRLTCQIDYSLLDKCHGNWEIKGKNGHLFQTPYLNAYYGVDFRGYDPIREKARKLKALQDTLARLGKLLTVVYAPSKASFYPEYFPDAYVRKLGNPTNHDVYKGLGDSLGINQIDMDGWFLSMKHTSKEPLFSKQGIHYTTYGAILASDSLVKYMERMRHIKLNPPIWTVGHSDELRNGDNDVALNLNLITPYTTEVLAYPVLKDPPHDSEAKKINIVVIGDSYAQKMILSGVVMQVSDQCEYWGYFEEMRAFNTGAHSEMQLYDWKAALGRADCLFLFYTTFTLHDFGSGFIEQAYDYYYPGGGK